MKTGCRKWFIIFLLMGIGIMPGFIADGQTFTVSGYLVDASSRETIIGATVLLKEKNLACISDMNGFFQLKGVPEGSWILDVSHLAYKPARQSVIISGKSLLLEEIRLQPFARELGEITVTGIRSDKAGDRQVETSLLEVTPKLIQSIPTARNDIFAAIKYLPGIEKTEPFSPLFTARGSDPGENAILLDGVTIYNPYHSSVSSGIFNTGTIKSVDLLVGGFGAEYGGRNAMVMYITTKDGNSEELHGEIEPSTFYSKGFLEFPAGKNGSMMVAGRYYYDIPMNFILYSQNYFYDFNLSYTNRLSNRSRITLKYFESKDHTGINFNSFYKYIGSTFDTDIYDDFDLRLLNNWSNRAATLVLKTVLSPSVYWRNQIYYSSNETSNLSSLDFVVDTEDENGQPMGLQWKAQSLFNSRIADYSGKSTLNLKLASFLSLNTGLEYNTYRFRNEVQMNEADQGTSTREPDLLALFAEAKITAGPLVVRPGLRLSNFENAGYLQEPRVNMVLKLPSGFRLKGAWGKYYQYIISMNTAEVEMNQSVDYYYPLSGRKPSESVHTILGIEKEFSQGNILSFDLYYKDIPRIYTFDLNQQEVGEAYSFTDKLQEGKGRAYGGEILIRGEYGALSGWASYGLAWTWRQYPHINEGEEYPYDYGRRHSFKTVFNYRFTKSLSYNNSFTWMSGAWHTIENMMQSFYYYDPLNNTVNLFPMWVSSSKNNARMPALINLDVGIRKQITGGFGKSLTTLLRADESYATVTIQNLLFLYRNVDWFIPGTGFPRYYNKYIPFGSNYFPSVGFSYTIKF
ncbi:MAG: TonB-dependent receptor [Bacteroidales bacterium]